MKNSAPEVNVARNFVSKRSLVPPIDIEEIIKEFAIVKWVDFPLKFDVDGLCLNLKTPGATKVFINSRDRPRNRLRFTLAHELGHILIPWHIGTILDRTSSALEEQFSTYWQMEGEANRFAAELLMPSSWLESLYQDEESPAIIVETIRSCAQVSLQAALIRLNSTLPPGFVYAAVEDGIVISSNRSSGTYAAKPIVGSPYIENIIPWAKNHWKKSFYQTTWHWWDCTTNTTLMEGDTAAWKDLLHEIVTEIVPDPRRLHHHKQSINGTISAAYNVVSRESASPPIFEICMQKFLSRSEHDDFTRNLVSHPKFREFLTSKILSLKSR